MLLTLTTTHNPATDIGFLLRKNPARSQVFTLSFGKAHVFYPEATPERCTVALLVDVDPVGLVRNRRGSSGEGGALEQYVNDRPYAASSFLSVAIAEVFGSALSGKSKERPELADTPLPLRVTFSALPCRGRLGGTGDSPVMVGDSPTDSTVPEILRRLFEPLGYTVSVHRLPLDEQFPDWGESAYHRVELDARLPLQTLLSHLYVLVLVLDNDKHYWVGDDEVEKLLRHGEGWLVGGTDRARRRRHGGEALGVHRQESARTRATCREMSWPRISPDHLRPGIHGGRKSRTTPRSRSFHEAVIGASRICSGCRSA